MHKCHTVHIEQDNIIVSSFGSSSAAEMLYGWKYRHLFKTARIKVTLRAGQRWYATSIWRMMTVNTRQQTLALHLTNLQEVGYNMSHTRDISIYHCKVHNSNATERQVSFQFPQKSFNENKMTEIMHSHIQINPVMKFSSVSGYLHFLYFNQLV